MHPQQLAAYLKLLDDQALWEYARLGNGYTPLGFEAFGSVCLQLAIKNAFEDIKKIGSNLEMFPTVEQEIQFMVGRDGYLERACVQLRRELESRQLKVFVFDELDGRSCAIKPEFWRTPHGMRALKDGKIARCYLKAAIGDESAVTVLGERSTQIFLANETSAALLGEDKVRPTGKRRGPKGTKTQRIVEEMVSELLTGKISITDLQNEKGIALAAKYDASRDTVCKATSRAIERYEERPKS